MPTGHSRSAQARAPSSSSSSAPPLSGHAADRDRIPRVPTPTASSTTTAASYLSALRQIDSIHVPDLASTLTNPASLISYTRDPNPADEEDEEESASQEASLRSWRDRIAAADPQDEWRAQNSSRLQSLSAEPGVRSGRAYQLLLEMAEESNRRRVDEREEQEMQQHQQQGQGPRTGSAEWQLEEARMQRDDAVWRRERLRQVLQRLNRLHAGSGTTDATGYGEDVPNHNSLYNWSPAGEESRAQQEQDDEQAELASIDRELRRSMPETHPEVLSAIAEVEFRQQDRQQRTGGTARPARHDAGSGNSERSLRSQAIVQAMRRHPRFSAARREYMQRYISDRSEAGAGDGTADAIPEVRARLSPTSDRLPWPPPASDRYPWNRRAGPSNLTASSSTVDYSWPRMRRSLLPDPSHGLSDGTESLSRSIIYLANLRDSRSYEDSLGYAVDGRFVTKEFFGDKHDDFVLDLNSLRPVSATSILCRGSNFRGHQRANPDLSPSRYSSIRRRWDRNIGSWDSLLDYPLPSSALGTGDYPRTTLDDTSRASSLSQPPPHAQRSRDQHARYPQPQQHIKHYTPDQWPVEVTIHDINWDTMTLSATMEAQNVPSHAPLSAPRNGSSQLHRSASFSSLPDLVNVDGTVPRSNSPPLLASSSASPTDYPHHSGDSLEVKPPDSPLANRTITTYLEGEILDWHTHTLLTENFPSTPANDGVYWRKLEPFRELVSNSAGGEDASAAAAQEDEVARKMLSKTFLEELDEKYVLMRWKERCFVEEAGQASHVSSGSGSGRAASSGDAADPGTASSAGTGGASGSAAGSSGNFDIVEGCGLTISGFYYVSLRRSDGRIEGLYCDPNSSPYQHLVLERSKSESWAWGWEFK